MTRPRRLLCWALVAGLALAACDYPSRWEGRYAAEGGDGLQGRVVLRLQPEGKGQWTSQAETTLLRWEERQGRLWLHTGTGAVLLGTPREDGRVLEVAVPAAGRFTFRKRPP